MDMRTLKREARRHGVKIEDDSLSIELVTIADGALFVVSDSHTLSYDYHNRKQRKDAIKDAIEDLRHGVYMEGEDA